MISALQIGNKQFDTNLIQGPLAGVSCAPFRLLTWRYSRPAFTYTEMISCKTIIYQSEHSLRRYLYKDTEEGPVCFQLSSNNPIELGEAVKRVTQAGADLIDLNCGCPVKKIRQKGAGSRLLSEPKTLFSLIKAMKLNTHLPISIKIRVEGDSDEKTNETIANVIEEAGADFVTVHGRHWTEHYETACRYDQIAYFAKRLSIPVIGNGDIKCYDSLQKMSKTNCAGMMIARAGVGQPWLIAKLTAEAANKNYKLPSASEVGDLFIEHVERLATLLQSDVFAIIQARKFAKYYAKQISEAKQFAAAINYCSDLVTLKNLVNTYF